MMHRLAWTYSVLSLVIGQAATPDQVAVILHLVGSDGQPQAGVALAVTLLRYGETIEEVPAGSCTTDAQGTCTLVVSDPPRRWNGQIEALVQPENSDQRVLLSWSGGTVEAWIYESDLALAATYAAPELSPRELYLGTETPLPTATRTAGARTATPTITPAATGTPFPPTQTATSTATPTEVPHTATPEAQVDLLHHPAAGPALILCGVLTLLAVGIGLLWGFRPPRPTSPLPEPPAASPAPEKSKKSGAAEDDPTPPEAE